MADRLKNTLRGHVIFCDDIRQEITGKHILIGVYGDSLNMNAGPGVLPIALWIQLFGLSAGEHNAKITARKHIGRQNTEVGSVDADIHVEHSDRSVAISMPGLPVHVDSDCSLTVEASFDGGAPIRCGELFITALFANSPQSH